MDKEFISFEQAKVLKELGFDETCFMYWKYEPDGKAYKYYFSEPNVENEVWDLYNWIVKEEKEVNND